MLRWLRGLAADADPAPALAAAREAIGAGRDAEAATALEDLLRRPTPPAAALHLRAVVHCRASEFGPARERLEQAVQADPALREAHLTLAEVHLEQQRPAEAVGSLRTAVSLDPADTPAVRRLLQVLGAAGRHDEAVELWQLLRLLDGPLDPASNPVAALHAQGRLVEAEAALEGQVRHLPGDAGLQQLLGVTRMARGRLDGAITAFHEAVRAAPDDARARGRLAFALDSCGEVAESLPHYLAAAERAGTPQAWSDWLAARLYAAPADAREAADAHARYAALFAGLSPSPHANAPDPARRLRIGYVSNDFGDHVIAYFLLPVLERHDRDAVEVWCYDRTAGRDAVSAAFERAADAWVPVQGLDADALAARIRADGIDVLVDLKGHFDDSALPAFARRPAPVQLSWLGYPDATGLPAMDGWITDAPIAADLSGQHDAGRAVVLPRFFMCFRPRPGAPDPGPLPARRNGHVTFASFNTWAKVSPAMREALVRLLVAVPGSRLLMTAAPGGLARARLLEQFAAAGVDPSRVELRGRGGHDQFLAWHREVDVALDSFPYNGTTTTLHSLWMGVPFVALTGHAHVSRVGVSILRNVGLEDWIATDVEDWISRAAAAAGDLDALEALRGTLRQRLAASPVMDEGGFVRDLESACRGAWRRWCEGRG
jgi:predicted O-linked N-acetylglucosamine transferase (SPINDLY family)